MHTATSKCLAAQQDPGGAAPVPTCAVRTAAREQEIEGLKNALEILGLKIGGA